jgi:hypothetical protein
VTGIQGTKGDTNCWTDGANGTDGLTQQYKEIKVKLVLLDLTVQMGLTVTGELEYKEVKVMTGLRDLTANGIDGVAEQLE